MNIPLNSSTTAPVGSFPLHADPDTYFSVAMMSLIEGLSGELLDTLMKISPFARHPCV